MKKETKELISWLKEHLSHYRIELATGRVKIGMVAGEKEEERAFAAIDFLNTLPEIESHLCRGGYIQDENGTPCCEGDKVRFCGEYDGVLRFGFMDGEDKNAALFPHFWFDFGGKIPVASDPVYFEKIEK